MVGEDDPDQQQDRDRRLARVPVPVGAPHDLGKDSPGRRGQHGEKQPEPGAHRGSNIVPRVAAPQIHHGGDAGHQECENSDPRHRHVEKDYPRRLTDKTFGRVDVEAAVEGAIPPVAQLAGRRVVPHVELRRRGRSPCC